MILYLGQSLLHIRKNICNIFNADGHADHIRPDTGFLQLRIAQLAMRRTCRVQHTGTQISHVNDN